MGKANRNVKLAARIPPKAPSQHAYHTWASRAGHPRRHRGCRPCKTLQLGLRSRRKLKMQSAQCARLFGIRLVVLDETQVRPMSRNHVSWKVSLNQPRPSAWRFGMMIWGRFIRIPKIVRLFAHYQCRPRCCSWFAWALTPVPPISDAYLAFNQKTIVIPIQLA